MSILKIVFFECIVSSTKNILLFLKSRRNHIFIFCSGHFSTLLSNNWCSLCLFADTVSSEQFFTSDIKAARACWWIIISWAFLKHFQLRIFLTSAKNFYLQNENNLSMIIFKFFLLSPFSIKKGRREIRSEKLIIILSFCHLRIFYARIYLRGKTTVVPIK